MEIENIKNNQSEMKNTLTEKRTTLQGINNTVDEIEDQISNLAEKEAENTQWEQPKEKKNPKNESHVRSHWDNLKCTNIFTMGLPEKEWEQEIENIFEKKKRWKTSLTW